MHPLFRLLTERPQLLAEHADAYAALIAAEVPRISAAWQRSTLLYALALCSALVGLVLAGVASMLWAALPALPLQAPWALIAAPALPLLASLVCLLAARSGRAVDAIALLRGQLQADIELLHQRARA
jgi:hypothetical protein